MKADKIKWRKDKKLTCRQICESIEKKGSNAKVAINDIIKELERERPYSRIYEAIQTLKKLEILSEENQAHIVKGNPKPGRPTKVFTLKDSDWRETLKIDDPVLDRCSDLILKINVAMLRLREVSVKEAKSLTDSKPFVIEIDGRENHLGPKEFCKELLQHYIDNIFTNNLKEQNVRSRIFWGLAKYRKRKTLEARQRFVHYPGSVFLKTISLKKK